MSSLKVVSAGDIRRLRKMLGLTQKELAIKARVSQSLISRIENENLDPRLSTIRKIINALTDVEKKRTAFDVMHSPVITIDSNNTIRAAVEIMKRHNISQMPVLKGTRIVGSIQEATILERISKSTSSEKLFSSFVYTVMEKGFERVSPSSSIDSVIYLLSQGNPAVVVIENGKLVGIITKIDIISSAINLKGELA